MSEEAGQIKPNNYEIAKEIGSLGSESYQETGDERSTVDCGEVSSTPNLENSNATSHVVMTPIVDDLSKQAEAGSSSNTDFGLHQYAF